MPVKQEGLNPHVWLSVFDHRTSVLQKVFYVKSFTLKMATSWATSTHVHLQVFNAKAHLSFYSGEFITYSITRISGVMHIFTSTPHMKISSTWIGSWRFPWLLNTSVILMTQQIWETPGWVKESSLSTGRRMSWMNKVIKMLWIIFQGI